MTIIEFEIKRCEKLVGEYVQKHSPPIHIRNKLDLDFRIKYQSIEIFEIRPLWDNPDKTIEGVQAKTWSVYWQRADLKWYSNQPNPEVNTLEQFLDFGR